MPTFFVNFLSFFCHFLSFNYMHLCLCIKSMHSKSNILNAIKNEYKLNINAFINALLLLPIAITFYASIRSKENAFIFIFLCIQLHLTTNTFFSGHLIPKKIFRIIYPGHQLQNNPEKISVKDHSITQISKKMSLNLVNFLLFYSRIQRIQILKYSKL